MRQLISRLFDTERPLPSALVLCLLITFAAQESAQAQSGRRAPVRQPTPPGQAAPAPETNPSPTPAATEAPVAKTGFLVAAQIKTKDVPDRAQKIFISFVQRLNQSSGATATAIGHLKRDEAIKRARAETESYVIWLELSADKLQEGTLVLWSADLIVKYSVFEPATGRVKTNGKVFYQPAEGARARSSSWPTGPPKKMTPEAAGEEAADLVLDWLSLTAGRQVLITK